MDNENIKEILDKWKCYIEFTKKFTTNEYEMLRVEDIEKALDYITNLQQENQDIKDTLQDKLDYIGHLKELCDKYEEEHNTEFKIWKDERCQLLDYKSRNKKAIEYCNREIGNIIANFDYVDTKDLENIRKILNGDDK